MAAFSVLDTAITVLYLVAAFGAGFVVDGLTRDRPFIVLR
jgi:hypothetical protein